MTDSSTQPAKILVVDDDNSNIMMLESIISDAIECKELTFARDGIEALSLLVKDNYQLIISDWNMPNMGGLDLLQNVRKNEQLKKIPFLMMTSRADKKSVIQALKAGANDYIAKPVDGNNLINKINRLLAPKIAQNTIHTETDQGAGTNQEPPEQKDLIESVREIFATDEVRLPTMPNIAQQLSQAYEDENITIHKIASIIEVDPALSAALIVISNSPFYQGSVPHRTLEQAISRFGAEATRHYVTTIQNRHLFSCNDEKFKQLMSKLWQHSLSTGICARAIGTALHHNDLELLFSLGLFHDIGTLLVLNILINLSEQRDDIDNDAIFGTIDALHGELGGELLNRWKLPEEFGHIARHHETPADQEQPSQELQIINLANLIAINIGYGLKEVDEIALAETTSAKALKLDGDALEEIVENATAEVHELLSLSQFTS